MRKWIFGLIGIVMVLMVSLGADQTIRTRLRGGIETGGEPPTLEITTLAMPTCTDDTPLSGWTIDAVGGAGAGNYTFSLLSGSLPGNATLVTVGSATASITGSDPGASSYNFTVRVVDTASAFDDQTYSGACAPVGGGGSGQLRTGHPRLHITPAADTGYGIPLDTLRTRINASYSSDFQTFITTVNGQPTTTTGKGQELGPACVDACYDGIAFALFAILNPSIMSSYSWGGKTQANYIEYAKAHALFIAANMYPTRTVDQWESKQDAENFTSDHQPELGIALIYDWTRAAGETWSDGDKITLLQPGIEIYKRRTSRAGSLFFSSGDGGWWVAPYIGLAFDASEAPSGSYTYDPDQPASVDGDEVTKTYAEWILEIQSTASTDWFDNSGAFLHQGWTGHLNTHYTTGHGSTQMAGMHLSAGYAEQWSIMMGLAAKLIGTAFNNDLSVVHPFWSNWGLWSLNSLRPAALADTSNGRRLEFIYGVGGPTPSLESGGSRLTLFIGAAMATSTDLQRVIKWVSTTGYDNLGQQSDTTWQLAYWPFFHFLYGMNHLGSAQSPSVGSIANSNAFGNGWYIFRHNTSGTGNGYEDATDTMVTVHNPKTYVTDGHWRQDLSSFTIEKFGMLLGKMGNNKNSLPDHINFQAESEIDHTRMLVVKSTDTGGVYKTSINNSDLTINRTGGFNGTRPISGANGTSYCANKDTNNDTLPYYCNVGDVPRVSISGTSTGYDYVRYVYTGVWDASKVDYADREVLYRRGTLNHEYIVVVDRLTNDGGSTSYRQLWNTKLPYIPACSTSLTQIELGINFVRNQGGVWTCPNSSYWTMTHDKAIMDGADTLYTGNGRLFLKSLAPGGVWTLIGGDFYHSRDATATFTPHGRSYKNITGSVTSGGVTTVTLSSGQDSQDTGNKVIISGSSDTNLNGYHTVTKLTSTTFTVPCASCATGGAAKALTNLKSDTGAESFGDARLQMEPSTARASNVFVTVIQFGQASTIGSTMTTTNVLCSGTMTETCSGTMIGAEINDSSAKTIYLFSNDSQGAVPTMPAIITPTITGSIRVLTFNLTPSTTYHYKADVAGNIELRTSSFGGSSSAATNSAGILDFTYTR